MNLTHVIDPELSLRLLEPRHAAEVFALIDRNREHLRPWFRWPPQVKDEAEVRAKIGEWLAQFASNGAFASAIVERGEAVGLIWFVAPGLEEGRVEIGYWLDQRAVGRGIVARACRAMVSYAFNVLGANRVTIKADVANARSRAVAERLGFGAEGVLRKWMAYPDGRLADVAVYGTVRGEWPHSEAPHFAMPIGDGLELRLREPRWAEPVFACVDANREHLAHWLPWVHQTRRVDDTRAAADDGLRAFAATGSLSTLIVQDGRFIGSAGVERIRREANEAQRLTFASADIGYWLAPEAQGRGVMTRTVAALLDHAFGAMGLYRVTIHAEPANERSCAVPRRLGFSHEGTLRSIGRYDGRNVDHHVFSMLAEEWKGRRREAGHGGL